MRRAERLDLTPGDGLEIGRYARQSHVELVDRNGGRARVSENADVLIAGWLR